MALRGHDVPGHCRLHLQRRQWHGACRPHARIERDTHMTSATSTFRPAPLRGTLTLRRVLAFDAFTCVAMGIALVTLANLVAGLTGLPEPLLTWAGVILFPSAGAMVLAAARPSRPLVLLVVAGNVLWIAASVAVLAIASPTPVGGAFVIAQAGAVAVLAWLEAHLPA
jgi:hypothetical protein